MAIVNGDFETGDFTGWATDVSGGTLTVQSTTKYEGTYAAEVNISGGYPSPGLFNLYQTIDLTGVNTLSFRLNITTFTGNSIFGVMIDGNEEYEKTITTEGWILVQINVSGYTGEKEVWFYAFCPIPDW